MVKFDTVFNAETTTALNKRALKNFTWLFIVLSALLIFLGVFLIVDAVNYPEEGDLGYGIFMLVFGVVLMPATYLLTNLLQKNVNKSMSILSDDTKETFEFTQDKIHIETTKSEEYSSSVTTSYKYLYKITETPAVYYLYISKMQCHVIQKKYLTEGTFEELVGYFNSNFNNVVSKSNCITYMNK